MTTFSFTFSVRLSVGRNTTNCSRLSNADALRTHEQVPTVVSDEFKKPVVWKKVVMHLFIVLMAHGLFESVTYVHDIIQT